MTTENQIRILRALEAIQSLAKITATNTLLCPNESIDNIIVDIRTIKYKLSIIDGIINPTVK